MKRIAFLGGGAHTIPSYRDVLKLLSREYQITLYSEFYLGDEWNVKEYTIKSVPSWKMNRRIRELWFAWIVVWDQFFQPADIIHSHSTYPSGLAGILAGRFLKKPVVVSLDAAEAVGLENIGFGDLLHKNRTSVNEYVLRHASAVTALTEFQKKSIVENLKIGKSVSVIPRGVDTSRFSFTKKEITSPIRFLNVAYLHPVKDQESLLRAFAIISKSLDASLTLVGKDYMDGKMEHLCDELGIRGRVHFEGFINHEKIQPYYEQADVLLHTSLYESQGVVIAEAFASGVLVCGTHVGLMADLSNSCCLTVAPGDYKSLALEIVQLLQSQEKIKSFITNANQWALRYDFQWTTDQYKIIYSKLLRS